ncbi:MAG: 2-amino-4-hydroxy-6-hydroxymethyldihydropteridine diphosphokinase [Flaviflexus sp.]|nr:2-amino-4-hydroxy-6-hydroxymethyldihydropteridine diphosphokinase [Flaviflexus sp.]
MAELRLPSGQLADRIELIGLAATGYHGVFDHEKRDGQRFSADVVCHTLTGAAAASDDLAATINYAELADAVMAELTGSYDLIETLAEKIAARALAAGALAVDVTVDKPEAPIPHEFTAARCAIRRLGPLLREPTPAADVVIAVGANLGDPRRQVVEGMDELEWGLIEPRRSTLWVTEAETLPGQGPQPDFVNAVIIGRTLDSPLALLERMRGIERAAGRVRTERWGPRTLDLDLISYKIAGREITSDHPELTLPHPRAAGRDFVTGPWLEVDPQATLDGTPL